MNLKITSLVIFIIILLMIPFTLSNKSIVETDISSPLMPTEEIRTITVLNKNNISVRKQYQVTTTRRIPRKIPYDNHLLAQVESGRSIPTESNKFMQYLASRTFKKPNIQLISKPKTLNKPDTQLTSRPKSNTNTKVKAVSKPTVTALITNKKNIQKKKTINIAQQLKDLQIIVNNIEAKPKQVKNKVVKSKRSVKNSPDIAQVDYWQTVYSIESKQGKLLYRPRNKARNCTYTLGPCGHHQLTVRALRDIGCKSLQCRKDRLNYNKSLKLSKKLLALNEKRLQKNGLTNLEGYKKYLIHQQGANGIKNIIAATHGKKELSKKIKKNMANNSPYSYKQFKRMGSKVAAKKFMQHWKHKWNIEKRLILASVSKPTNNQINTRVVPTFTDNDLNFALNLTF